MGITNELKNHIMKVRGIKFADLDHLLQMMNRIDQAHTSALECAHDAGYDDGYKDGYGKLAEHGWVKLPRDEDGVPIHPGDKLDGYNDTTTVKGLTLSANGWDMICDNGLWHDPKAFTHHKDTVEDVLREFADRICSSDHIVNGGKYLSLEDTGLLAEYAEKLRLAGEDA